VKRCNLNLEECRRGACDTHGRRGVDKAREASPFAGSGGKGNGGGGGGGGGGGVSCSLKRREPSFVVSGGRVSFGG